MVGQYDYVCIAICIYVLILYVVCNYIVIVLYCVYVYLCMLCVLVLCFVYSGMVERLCRMPCLNNKSNQINQINH